MSKTKAPASLSRVPQQSVVVYRAGNQIVPPIGQPFEFTSEELADIERINPDAVTALAVVDLSQQPQSAESGL